MAARCRRPIQLLVKSCSLPSFPFALQVIEEAPAPGISADFRRSIGESAVAAAKAGEEEAAGEGRAPLEPECAS